MVTSQPNCLNSELQNADDSSTVILFHEKKNEMRHIKTINAPWKALPARIEAIFADGEALKNFIFVRRPEREDDFRSIAEFFNPTSFQSAKKIEVLIIGAEAECKF